MSAARISFFVHAPEDDVGVAVAALEPGATLTGRVLRTSEQVQAEVHESVELGHKFALRDIDEGDDVVKDGVEIGRTTAPVRRGCHVHVHNLRSVAWAPKA